MKNESNDRRVRRTKKLLLQGLMQLMKQKKVKNITVRELSDLVDINRGTFYLYYRDINDMVESVETELLEKFYNIIEEHIGDRDNKELLPFLNTLFSFIEENREMCTLLLSENGDKAFLQRLNDSLRDKYRKQAYESKSDMDETEFDYLYGFIVFGIIGLIHCWLERNCAESVESMAALADRLVKHPLTGNNK